MPPYRPRKTIGKPMSANKWSVIKLLREIIQGQSKIEFLPQLFCKMMIHHSPINRII